MMGLDPTFCHHMGFYPTQSRNTRKNIELVALNQGSWPQASSEDDHPDRSSEIPPGKFDDALVAAGRLLDGGAASAQVAPSPGI